MHPGRTGGIQPSPHAGVKAPAWGAPVPGLSTTVRWQSAPGQTMDTTWSELLLIGLLLAVVVLSGRV